VKSQSIKRITVPETGENGKTGRLASAYVVVVSYIAEQVTVRHERQNDERHSIGVECDSDQSQNMLVPKPTHRQRLVQKRPHLHRARTVTFCACAAHAGLYKIAFW